MESSSNNSNKLDRTDSPTTTATTTDVHASHSKPHKHSHQTNTTSVDAAIEYERIHKTGSLILSYRVLEDIPPKLFELTHLKSLDLSNNVITSKSLVGISKLNDLKELDLSHNNITSLPRDFLLSNNLKEICLACNPLEDPPLDICMKGITAIRSYLLKKEKKDKKDKDSPTFEKGKLKIEEQTYDSSE